LTINNVEYNEVYNIDIVGGWSLFYIFLTILYTPSQASNSFIIPATCPNPFPVTATAPSKNINHINRRQFQPPSFSLFLRFPAHFTGL
jgi:hypothetical protein